MFQATACGDQFLCVSVYVYIQSSDSRILREDSPPLSMESQFDFSVQVGNLPRGSVCRRRRFTVFQLPSSSSLDLHPSCSNSDCVVLLKSGSLGRISRRACRPIGRIWTRAPAFHLYSRYSIYASCFLYAKLEYNMYITLNQN